MLCPKRDNDINCKRNGVALNWTGEVLKTNCVAKSYCRGPERVEVVLKRKDLTLKRKKYNMGVKGVAKITNVMCLKGLILYLMWLTFISLRTVEVLQRNGVGSKMKGVSL
jgi:hypothetical protein